MVWNCFESGKPNFKQFLKVAKASHRKLKWTSIWGLWQKQSAKCAFGECLSSFEWRSCAVNHNHRDLWWESRVGGTSMTPVHGHDDCVQRQRTKAHETTKLRLIIVITVHLKHCIRVQRWDINNINKYVIDRSINESPFICIFLLSASNEFEDWSFREPFWIRNRAQMQIEIKNSEDRRNRRRSDSQSTRRNEMEIKHCFAFDEY